MGLRRLRARGRLIAGGLSGSYLLTWAVFVPANREVLAAVIGSERYRSFLRLHIAADGSLTIHPVAVDPADRWALAPDGAPGDPWLRPMGPLVSRLIEPPVRILG